MRDNSDTLNQIEDVIESFYPKFCIVIEGEWSSTRFEENYDMPPSCVGDWSRPLPSGLPCSGNGCSWTYECFGGVIEIEREK